MVEELRGIMVITTTTRYPGIRLKGYKNTEKVSLGIEQAYLVRVTPKAIQGNIRPGAPVDKQDAGVGIQLDSHDVSDNVCGLDPP
jgi:hypothetical protein